MKITLLGNLLLDSNSSMCVYILVCTSLAGAMSIDTLLSSTSITFDKIVLVVLNSEGRREVPLLSVAIVSWVVSEALFSKISAVVLFVVNISSACRNELNYNMNISATRQRRQNGVLNTYVLDE